MKRFLVPLLALFVATSCGPAIDGTWRSTELSLANNWIRRDTLQFGGNYLTIWSDCYKDADVVVDTYRSMGSGQFRLTGSVLVIPEKIRVRDASVSGTCNWDISAGEHLYALSKDHSTLTIFFDGQAVSYHRE